MTPKPAIKMPSLSRPYPCGEAMMTPCLPFDGTSMAKVRASPRGDGPCAMRIAASARPKNDRPRAEILAIPLPSAANVPAGLGGRQECKKCPRQSEHLPSTMPVLASSRALMPTWRSHPTPPSPASGRRGCHPMLTPVFPKRAAEFDVRFGRPKPHSHAARKARWRGSGKEDRRCPLEASARRSHVRIRVLDRSPSRAPSLIGEVSAFGFQSWSARTTSTPGGTTKRNSASEKAGSRSQFEKAYSLR